jgi:hypothetical protein
VIIEGEEGYLTLLAHDPCQLLAIFLIFQSIPPGSPTPSFRKPMVTIPSLADVPLLTKMTGNILSFRLFGQVIIVLNTAKAAKDLLEKRAAIYSDRPVFPLYEMCVISFCTQGVLTHNN